MNNSETPNGEYGRNEIKIKKSNIEENMMKFFEGEELEVCGFGFDYPEQSKMINGDEQDELMIGEIYVEEYAKCVFEIEAIINGAKASVRREEKDKIKHAKEKVIAKKLKEKMNKENKQDSER